jgi:glycosyltransferase involved in cell wall biosynthesis
MRILHLDAGNEMRGGQWQVLRLIDGLAVYGVESTLLARPGACLYDAARRKSRRVEPLSFARAVLLARNHDLVHAHDARAHTLGAIIAGAPLVVSRRVAFGFGEAGLRPALPGRWKYARPAHYMAVSEHVKSVLIERGVPPQRITVVYDGVPLLEPGQAAGLPHILALANANDPQKGAPLALEAARLAGLDLHLTSDLEADLRRASAFVYITRSEGLGSAVLLAMSAAVPVIASRMGGLLEVIRHGETGLLVENDAYAIAAAMRELLAKPAWARQLGAAARRAVAEHFTVDHMVRRTMEIYQKVLS